MFYIVTVFKDPKLATGEELDHVRNNHVHQTRDSRGASFHIYMELHLVNIILLFSNPHVFVHLLLYL